MRFKITSANLSAQVWVKFDMHNAKNIHFRGRKTRAVIKGLGPEELYTIRVGVSEYLGEDRWGEEVWSDAIISATQCKNY